jgi:RimJ/RimL family protein N-acetyltransferase
MSMHRTQDFSENSLLASFPSSTNRLKLVRRDRQLASAEGGQNSDFSKAIGAAVPPSWPPTFHGPLDGRERLAWNNYYLILTGDEGGPALVGFAGAALWPAEERTIEFGAVVVPEFGGRRLGEELASAVGDWAVSQPDIDRVICDAPAGHGGIAKSFERSGFSKMVEVPGPGFERFVRFVGTRT